MRLFLSYGHDEHVPLALRIKADLKREGYEVWFDVDGLTGGTAWETYIADALDGAERFVLLLTPHSVRPDSYCLKEMRRAMKCRIRMTPLKAAKVEEPVDLNRTQWLDFRESGKYENSFAQLLDSIEHDRLDRSGRQARLQRILQPIDYDEPARHLERFTGRQWALRQVDQWLARSGRPAAASGVSAVRMRNIPGSTRPRPPRISMTRMNRRNATGNGVWPLASVRPQTEKQYLTTNSDPPWCPL